MTTFPCHNIFSFNFASFNPLLAPSNVASVGGFPSLYNLVISKINSQHLLESSINAIKGMSGEALRTKNPSLFYFLNSYGLLNNLDRVTEKLSDYVIHSPFDKFHHMLVFGMVYEVLQVASISAYNKIQNTEMNKYAKLTVSALVSATPYLIMYGLGYDSRELLLSAAFRYASAYVLPTVYGNFVRKMDMVSTTKNFSLKNMLTLNMYSFVRNAALTFGVDSFLETAASGVLRNTTSLGICIHNNAISPFKIEMSNPMLYPLSFVMNEMGWSLGRIIVDTSLGLLNKIGIIADLRDVFATPPKPKTVAVVKPVVKEDIKKERVKSGPSTYVPPIDDKVVKSVSKRNKVVIEEPNIQVVKKEVAVKPGDIEVADFAPIHFTLENKDIDTSFIPMLLPNIKMNNFDTYAQNFLNCTHLNDGKISSLQQDIYEVRSTLNARILGVKYDIKTPEGFQAILEKCYGLERANNISQHFHSTPSKLIIFLKEVSKHEDINRCSLELKRNNPYAGLSV